MKLYQGDVFRIKTSKGFGFLQYVDTDSARIEFVRVLEPIVEAGIIDQEGVDLKERWNIRFSLRAAVRRKIVEKVGSYNLPKSFKKLEYARSKHIIKGEFIGWFIVDRESLKRNLKKELTEEDLKLSPEGIMNDTLIIEYLT